ncbi:hypothetical protein NQZ68_035484 [Dissostichus eleginoides]|nr:hypothetical protein NQZ68_035484 [Dissostichus eleginoides]
MCSVLCMMDAPGHFGSLINTKRRRHSSYTRKTTQKRHEGDQDTLQKLRNTPIARKGRTSPSQRVRETAAERQGIFADKVLKDGSKAVCRDRVCLRFQLSDSVPINL